MQCRLYGSNICGEGGEYETLALGGPLFRHACIHLNEWDVRMHSPDSVAPVGVLHPSSFHLIPSTPTAAEHDSAANDALSIQCTEGRSSYPDRGGMGTSLGMVVPVPGEFWAPSTVTPAGKIQRLKTKPLCTQKCLMSLLCTQGRVNA